MEYEIGVGTVFFFLILIILVIVGIVVGIRRIRLMMRRPEVLGMSREDIKKRWQSIEELLDREDEMSYKLAVLEADKLLDHALKSMGTGGNNLGERIKLMSYKYPKLRNVWPAHIMRNKIAHEASYHMSKGNARNAIYQFKQALRELGTLS
ncbi:MAG: hypothetical protein Q7R79_02125 [bacterium]|nr:hypothetical protein [bacterium]